MTRELMYFPAGKGDRSIPVHVDHDAFGASWSWWHLGATAGLGLGIISGFLGCFLTLLVWFVGGEFSASPVSSIATGLVAVTFPLMLFGAHALDKIDDMVDAKRIEYCKRTGLNDENCK